MENARRLSEIAAIRAIGEQLDKVEFVVKYNGTELTDEEHLALRAGAAGALAGVVAMLEGEEVGSGPCTIARRMLEAAGLAHVSSLEKLYG